MSTRDKNIAKCHEWRKANRAHHVEYGRQYDRTNRAAKLARLAKYDADPVHKTIAKERRRRRYLKDRELECARHKKYHADHRDVALAAMKRRYQEKRK